MVRLTLPVEGARDDQGEEGGETEDAARSDGIVTQSVEETRGRGAGCWWLRWLFNDVVPT
jgi:hypothetical protein